MTLTDLFTFEIARTLCDVAPLGHNARSHDKISPSKLNYLDPEVGGCPGFNGDDTSNEAAEEGTRNHELTEKLLIEALKENIFERGITFEEYVGIRAESGHWDERTKYLISFAARSADLYLKGKRAEHIVQEFEVRLKRLNGKKLMKGHTDVFIWMSADVGVQIDWKFGVIPVLPADTNRQGLAYAVGCFQKWPQLNRVGVIFVQPALNYVSKAVYHRTQLYGYLSKIELIFDTANYVGGCIERGEDNPAALESLNPGSTCTYCARVGKCPAVHQKLPMVVEKAGGMPDCPTLNLDAIRTPEQAALAAAWATWLSDEVLGAVRSHCKEIAKANGGTIRYEPTDGRNPISFSIKKRLLNRTVGSAVEVANALTEYVAAEDVLAAATLSLGTLSEITVPAVKAKIQAETGEVVTQKKANEMFESILESQGLLSREDGYVEILARDKEKVEKPVKSKKQLKAK